MSNTTTTTNNAITTVNGNAFTTLNISGIKDNTLKAYAVQLDTLEASGRAFAGKFVEEANKVRAKQARVLAEVESTKAYEKGGFKTATAYAVAIGFPEPTARALIASGRIYNDPKTPAEIKALSPSSVSVLASAIKNAPEVVYNDAKNGVINAKSAQADLKEYARGVNEAHAKKTPKLAKLYTATSLYKPLLIDNERKTLDDLKNALDSAYAVVERIAKDEDENPRFLVMTKDYADVIVVAEWRPTPKKSNAVAFNSPADFLKAKRAAGVDEDTLKLVCATIGIEYTAPEA